MGTDVADFIPPKRPPQTSWWIDSAPKTSAEARRLNTVKQPNKKELWLLYLEMNPRERHRRLRQTDSKRTIKNEIRRQLKSSLQKGRHIPRALVSSDRF